MAAVEVPWSLVRGQIDALRYAFKEAVRRANEAVRQRDYYRERALEAECALRRAADMCPDDGKDLCRKLLGEMCRACGEDIDKEARYLWSI